MSLLTISICFLLAFFSNTARCQDLRDADQIVTPPKTIKRVDQVVFVKGKWKEYAGNQKLDRNKPPLIHAVSITCDKDTMICREVIAGIVQTEDHRSNGRTAFLNIEEKDYRIGQWSDDIIVAKHIESDDSKFEIRISLKDETAERYFTETKPRACAVCDPEGFEWWVME